LEQAEQIQLSSLEQTKAKGGPMDGGMGGLPSIGAPTAEEEKIKYNNSVSS